MQYNILSSKPIRLSFLLVGLGFAASSLACSDFFIAAPGIAANARTTDLEFNTGNTFGFGARDSVNTSNINFPQKAPIHAMQWKNQYAYLGQSMFHTYILSDGLNSQGLYAAFLDLPNVSYYPSYDPQDPRPELGFADTVNYVLGTAKDVPEAIDQLNKAQIVVNGLEVDLKGKALFGGLAIHLVLRDAKGNNAVLEWTKDNGQSVEHVYYHQAGTDYVVETTPGVKKQKVYRHCNGWVVTNAPAYGWQLQNAARYNYMFTGSTKQQWDGQYMNGSGMAGIPGSWTPPDRFARGTQLGRLMPTPNTQAQAMALAWSGIQTMRVPAGANPAATLWASLSDLENKVYYWKPLMGSEPDNTSHQITLSLPAFNNQWQSYDVLDYAKKNEVPDGWVSAQVRPGKKMSAAEAQAELKMVYAPTPGNTKTRVVLVK